MSRPGAEKKQNFFNESKYPKTRSELLELIYKNQNSLQISIVREGKNTNRFLASIFLITHTGYDVIYNTNASIYSFENILSEIKKILEESGGLVDEKKIHTSLLGKTGIELILNKLRIQQFNNVMMLSTEGLEVKLAVI